MFCSYWERLRKVFAEDPEMITHTEQVFYYAESIAQDLGIEGKGRRIVQLAALLHDVGIVEAFRKYGSREGKYQHMEGPPLARKIMEEFGETQEVVDRVVFLVGHHHDLSSVDGCDFQILVEADMLVNLANEKEKMSAEELPQFINSFFRTSKGRWFAEEKYLSSQKGRS
ncbi:MAG: HD domain-containing protein [Candidatus Caldatribacteriaceae bacterium]